MQMEQLHCLRQSLISAAVNKGHSMFTEQSWILVMLEFYLEKAIATCVQPHSQTSDARQKNPHTQ
jgi:hypothetical protein